MKYLRFKLSNKLYLHLCWNPIKWKNIPKPSAQIGYINYSEDLKFLGEKYKVEIGKLIITVTEHTKRDKPL